MFERKLLAFILHSTLVRFREKGIEIDDKPLFWLSHLLHNVPYDLLDDEKSKISLENLVADVNTFKLDRWFKLEREGFLMANPEYKDNPLFKFEENEP
ncbi:hypothetical protein LX64_02671 [Chitinophaga skermanii]|uniref:Uncharacterized protein n=1 Tax=Chitinophaga skermanii TaxID=331697 RepID=A0A327QMM9_9BACT|nr:hypothetical protein [Chitinophaga skermanii]RAJ05511.1 hypothetical protein LX64_02671 [Chitinophaga skermanii]